MKGSAFKPNEKTIELLDGKHKIAIDFNAFEQLEGIYGDMQTAFNKFSTKDVKFADIKNFLTAGINACVESEEDRVSTFYVGKILNIGKLSEYVAILMELLTNAVPDKKEMDDDEEEKN